MATDAAEVEVLAMPKGAAEPSRRARNVRAQEVTGPDMLYGTGATEPGDPDICAAAFASAHIGLPPSALYSGKRLNT